MRLKEIEEKDKLVAELIIANKELAFQIGEKADRAAELIVTNKELAFQSEEKADSVAELIIAIKEITYQSKEIADCVAELVIANLSHELKTPLNVIFSITQLFDMYCKSGFESVFSYMSPTISLYKYAF